MVDALKEAVKKVGEGVEKLGVSEPPNSPKQSKKHEPQADKQAASGAKKDGKKDKKVKSGGSGTADELSPPPAFIQERIDMFDKIKAEYDADVAKKPRVNINILLDNDRIECGKSWETTPADVARSISKSLFERVVVAEVDGEVWDLERPLEKSCRLRLLDFEHPEGKKVFWHSSAHLLGECAEKRWGCSLCIGPPVDDGFYYEMALPGGDAVQFSDFEPLERIANKAIKEKQKFERLELTKDQLLQMFAYNKYKQHIIQDKIPDGSKTTVYRNGPLIDLCRGPHVPHTGRIKSFKIMKNSASYFLGDNQNDSLQRIYGVSFPDNKLMQEHLHYLEEAAKRDHRKIGREQELFFFHELSPGSCFFLPHGTIIYNTLQALLREEYWKRGYQEVTTPNMFNHKLWLTSGHWQHYKDDMFTFDVEKEAWALKPMNCPGHMLLFKFRERSYRELPMRIADFGVLHRNEASGALTGLTRVRRFQQDDTHIFCTQDQVDQEIYGLFDFLRTIYGKLGFPFKMKLSTRPDEFLGDISTWDKAELKLKESLERFAAEGGAAWELNPGDGAFYGPKIDITISDALRREHQCATIQLDFQLPQRFELEYMTAEKTKVDETTKPEATSAEPPKSAEQPNGVEKDQPKVPKDPAPGYARPVVIHRAIYGSFERFVAILCEHFGGKWPFWLSPRQILIIPVMPAANSYVEELQKIFREKGFHTDIDIGGNTMQKKIRTGQLAQYNFIFGK